MRHRLPFAGAALAAAAFVAVAAGCGDNSEIGSPSSDSATYSVSQYAGATGSTHARSMSASGSTGSSSAGSAAGTTSTGGTPGSSTNASATSGASGSSTTGASGSASSSTATGGTTTTNPTGSPSRVYVFDSGGRTIVNASLVPTYLDSQNVLAPPGGTAGWYAERGWALPGKRGASILVGHVTWGGAPDTFYNLLKVVPGNKILVTYTSGDRVSFTATQSRPVSKAAVPKDGTIWAANSPTPVLRLITCDPKTPINGGHFEGNWVVWANPG
mgnify:CR=1 FL=1